MQMDGDLSALEEVLGRKVLRKSRGTGSCSALIKLLPSNKDLLISHVTWSSYDGMLRIFKFYDFPFNSNGGIACLGFFLVNVRKLFSCLQWSTSPCEN